MIARQAANSWSKQSNKLQQVCPGNYTLMQAGEIMMLSQPWLIVFAEDFFPVFPGGLSAGHSRLSIPSLLPPARPLPQHS